MLKKRRNGLWALMLLLHMSIQAQESVYYVGQYDSLHKVSLSDQESSVIGKVPLINIPGSFGYVTDFIHSGDSLIYFLGRSSGNAVPIWELVKFKLADNSFSSLGTLPGLESRYVYFDSVVNAGEIILDVSSDSDDFHQYSLSLTDLSLVDLELISPRSADWHVGQYLRDPVDKTIWVMERTDSEKELFQYDAFSGEYNGPFFSTDLASKLAFDGLGGVFMTKSINGYNFIGKVDVNSGIFEKVTPDTVGFVLKLGIPLPEKVEGAFLKVSAPQVRLRGVGDGFRPLHWNLKTTNRGDRAFIIDSVRWGQTVFDIEGEQDNLILQVGESKNLELKYTAVDLAVSQDTLKIYANSEGLYKKVPLQGRFILTSDGVDLNPLTVDGLLVKENSKLVERGENFEKLDDVITTCRLCRHAISPEGVLFRLTNNAALQVYDPLNDYFLQVADLSDRISIPVDLTFRDDGTILILDRLRTRGIYGDVFLNWWRIKHYEYLSDTIISTQIIHHAIEGGVYDVRAKAIEYDEEINKTLVLYSKFGTPDLNMPTEIRSYDSSSSNEEIVAFSGVTIDDLYQGKAGAWFGLESGSIFHLDRQTQQAVKIVHIDAAEEIVGYKATESDTIAFSHTRADFDQVLVGDDTVRHVFIANRTEETVQIEEIAFSDNSFSTAQELPLEISPGVSAVTLSFSFRPESQGLLRDTARITLSNGQQANWQVDIVLEGEGITADETIKFTSLEVDLGTTFVSKTNTAGISAANISQRTVQIEDITFDNPVFTYLGELPLDILPGQLAQEVDFTFSPDSDGSETGIATMTLNNGQSSWQAQIEMRGEGDFGTVWSDVAINFGEVAVAEDSIISITMHNRDVSGSIEVDEITFDNPAFSHKMELPFKVYAADGDFPVRFAFMPVAEGGETGTATLYLNKAPNSWLVRIELAGEGTPLQIVTSLESEDALNGLQVFPNPLKNTSKLSFSKVNPRVEELKFFNLHGQLQYSYHTESRTQFDIDLGKFASEGMLLIRFLSKDGKYLGSRPLLIQH